mgnify:CR=1 FL=1
MKRQEQLARELRAHGAPLGYSVEKGKNEYVVFCHRFDDQGCRVQVAVYFSEKFSRGYTVATAITHPKRGKTQLLRKGCEWSDVLTLLQNPRQHTGRGYYQK